MASDTSSTTPTTTTAEAVPAYPVAIASYVETAQEEEQQQEEQPAMDSALTDVAVAAVDLDHNMTPNNTPGHKRKPARSENESREIRLEQNRVAARESRKRKKKMVEDLQQSIIFYTRANALLKQQNEYMQRLIAEKSGQQQQAQVSEWEWLMCVCLWQCMEM